MSTATLAKGTIVLYQNGWYRLTRVTSKTVNLGAVWGGHVYHKRVPIDQVVEDEAAWYDNWRKSESYQCM